MESANQKKRVFCFELLILHDDEVGGGEEIEEEDYEFSICRDR